MNKQCLIIKKYYNFLDKEEYKPKYLKRSKNINKLKVFKKKRKSFTRRDKQLKRFKRKLYKYAYSVYNKKNSMFSQRLKYTEKYKLNLISRLKLKKKWIL